jgi:PhnB protein
MDVNIYLTFDGRCAEAFAEYARVLGGEVAFQQTYGETPMAEHTAPEQHARVMHSELKLGDKVIMGSDAPPEWYTTPGGFSVSLHFDELDEGRRAFDALAEGGTVKMPLQETFWAKGFGMLIDRFGTPWIVNCGHAEGQG